MELKHTTPNCLKCLKIAYHLNNGASIAELKALFTAEEMVKKVVNKSYDSIPHLSMSRLGFSDSHIDMKQELFLTQQLPNLDCILYIEEKMDGSNCAVIRKKGEIIPIGRSGYRCIDSNFEQHRMFHQYVMKRKHMFEALLPDEDDRVVGEWLAMAHGTLYPNITEPYQVFELFKGGKKLDYQSKTKEFDKHEFVQVPLLYKGIEAVSVHDALQMAKEHNPLSEGVVYRLEIKPKLSTKYQPHIIAKVVRMDKEDGIYLIPDQPIWMWKEPEIVHRNIYRGDWTCKNDLIRTGDNYYGHISELSQEQLDKMNIIYATYEPGDYDGRGFILWEQDGKLYEWNCSHCSCDGLVWDDEELEETSLDSILRRDNDWIKDFRESVLGEKNVK